MSTTPTAPTHPVPGEALSEQAEIRIVSHSNLFYWWPVWAVGFIMAAITWLNNHYMVIVPAKTQYGIVHQDAEAEVVDQPTKVQLRNKEVLVAPDTYKKGQPVMEQPHLRTAQIGRAHV